MIKSLLLKVIFYHYIYKGITCLLYGTAKNLKFALLLKMKAIKDNKRNCWTVEKGKIIISIFPGCDRPKTPVRIEFEGQIYEIYKYGLIDIIKGFEGTYSEEQVLEQLVKFTCC